MSIDDLGPLHENQRVFRHSEANRKEFDLAFGDNYNIELISQHIEKYVGPISGVFHELISDQVHIDVHVVPPHSDRPCYSLVTTGMSDLPMVLPDELREHDIPRYMELMINLPPEWKMTKSDFKDENWYWPIRLLKTLARLPHEYDTWLGLGHTMPNGDPAEPFADNTALCGAIILPPVTIDEAFHTLQIDEEKTISFACILPLYEEEMNLKLKRGVEALVEKLSKYEMDDIVDINRKNVAKKRFGFF